MENKALFVSIVAILLFVHRASSQELVSQFLNVTTLSSVPIFLQCSVPGDELVSLTYTNAIGSQLVWASVTFPSPSSALVTFQNTQNLPIVASAVCVAVPPGVVRRRNSNTATVPTTVGVFASANVSCVTNTRIVDVHCSFSGSTAKFFCQRSLISATSGRCSCRLTKPLGTSAVGAFRAFAICL
uniref:Transmembrane protein n=1 Tax=Compsopogon caeruleus TaxID=31354 RepID=A0A7S1TJV3_9RHOD